jgi:hypothetical protein
MIGNTIEFHDYTSRHITKDIRREPDKLEGLVVDAFTEVSGSVSGSSEVFLGFGGGKTSGQTKSKRMYKVEYYETWDKKKKHKYYKDIHAWQLIRIIAFAKAPDQEKNEENIKI